MSISSGLALRALAPLTFLLAQTAVLPAQTVEQPPSFNAAQIPGIKRVDDNYTIRNPVKSDGILRIYVLATPYGDITVQGDEMLRMRINELKALALLEKVSNSESFGKALAEAGLSPIKFAGGLIINPVGTVQNTFAGVGNFFGRMSSGMANSGKTPDDAMSSLLGVTDQRRQLAADLWRRSLYRSGPACRETASAVAGGGDRRPGGDRRDDRRSRRRAGIIVSNLSTANKLNDLGLEEVARKYTASQILDINRDLLKKMGVDDELSNKLLVQHQLHADRHGGDGGGARQHERGAATATCSWRARRRPTAAPSPTSCGGRRN